MKSDIYQEVTERIIAALETGVVPWRSPYLQSVGLPENFSSRKGYSGANVLLLLIEQRSSPFWLTYKQAQELGGQVKKGEKGTRIIKYGTFQPKKAKENSDTEKTKNVGFLKSYTVFNSEQIEGITFPSLPNDTRSDVEKITEADAICDAYLNAPNAPRLVIGENNSVAFYRSSDDLVSMPEQSKISSDGEFYAMLFHELAHSTGHQTRLNRPLGNAKNSTAYAKEELIAEMTASFLSAQAGILDQEVFENSAAYLATWISCLRQTENKKLVIQASSQATKASEFITADSMRPALSVAA